jgi:hypothetical protein
MKIKVPTATSVVEHEMKFLDDFVTSKQLQKITRLDANHVGAALSHLKKHRAVDCLESEGQLWWFSTPDMDTRCRTVQERTPEKKPRKQRKSSNKNKE